MIRVLLICALILSTVLPATAERLWLVIGASDDSAARIAQKTKLFAQSALKSLIVQTADCGDKKNIFAWVPQIAASADSAQIELRRIRESVKDAYVKRCDVKQGTLLALRITAVDASIADVPGDVVNWEEEDRVSSAHPLPDGRVLVTVRYFTGITDDPLEGRRERVIIAESSGIHLILEDNCPSPGSTIVQHGCIAFSCAREQAGDHLLHNVLVFDTAGRKLAEIQHCRNPRWSGAHSIICDAESMGPDGRLKLTSKRTDVDR